MKTLGRNANNDLYLEAGGLAILHDADAQCAVIESVLQTQRGELQFDSEGGIDYFGTVLQNPNNIDFWAAQVTTTIESLDFVSSVEDFQYRFDRETSTLYWSMSVVTTDDIRLDLQNKKTVMDASPGDTVDVDWNDIYDKPTGVDETLGMVEDMRDEAQDLEELGEKSTLANVKGVLNRVIYDPNDKTYAESRLLRFTFSGVPLGTIIDFSNLSIGLQNIGTEENPRYVPFTVEISDGTKRRSLTKLDGSELADDGNEIWFPDETAKPDADGKYPPTQKHTIMSVKSGGVVELTIRGNITSLKAIDSSKPIFLRSNEEDPFPYATGFAVGSRVPLATVGNGAFRGFRNLQTVVWGESSDAQADIVFGDSAFEGCSSLIDLSWLPYGLTAIGENCFKDCSGIVGLSSVLKKDDNTTYVRGLSITKVAAIPNGAFNGCSSLTTLEYVPAAVTSLGVRSFANCTSLKNLDKLSDSIETIGNECFYGCSGMTTLLYFPDELNEIGNGCFQGCSSLRSLYVPEGLTTIGDKAFAECPSLTNVLCESTTPPTISEGTFDQESLEVYVPLESIESYKLADGWRKYWDGGVETIYEYGEFKIGLNGVSAGDSLLGTTSIVESNSIWQVEYTGSGEEPQRFESSETSLPDFTYTQTPNDGDEGRSNVVLKGFIRRISAVSSDSYPVIATTAAAENTLVVSLESSLATSLELIGDYAFANCINLATVTLRQSDVPLCLGERAFYNCSSLDKTEWLNERPNFGRTIESITQEYDLDEDGNIQYDDDGNPIMKDVPTYFPAFGAGCFWKSGITELSYPPTYVDALPEYCFAETKIESLSGMGSTVLETLGDHCFYGCTELDNLVALSDTGVTAIPEYCFANCSGLTTIDGISNIIELDAHCFENCSSLSSIAPLKGVDAISAIPDYAFAGCTSLTALAGIENIITLGEYAFAGCTSLSDIRRLEYASRVLLDGSVVLETISEHCFDGCTGLKTLEGCFNIVSIGDGAFANCTALRSPAGLGPSVSSIGDYAFQNCSGLQYFSCLATTVPSVSSTAFSGVSVSSIPLYVRKGYESLYANASVWRSFESVTSRYVTIHLENIEEITTAAAGNTAVSALIADGEVSIPGVWFVDYGDGNDFETYYAQEGDTSIGTHSYDARGGYDITLFGDIVSISGKVSDGEMVPFLGGLEDHAASVTVSSTYFRSVGDYCFYNYGIPGVSLSVHLAMADSSSIGSYSFAKAEGKEGCGPIGTISAFTATTIGAHAFDRGGLDSSAPFSPVTTADEYAFANNTALTELFGFGNLTEVPKGMFYGCTALETTSGLSSITRIGEEGFVGCTAMTSVRDFGTSLVSIGKNAFSGCTAIENIFVAIDEPPSLPSDGFSAKTFESATVYVPAGRESVYQATEFWTKFGDRVISRSIKFVLANVKAGSRIKENMCTVSATGAWTISYGGEQTIQFSAGDTKLPAYTFTSGCPNGQMEIKISGPITAIASTSSAYPAFGESVGKNEWLVGIESSSAMEITSFGNYAFAGCPNLGYVKNASTVTSVGERAFANDASLADVSGLAGVSEIANYAFTGCAKLESLYGLSSVKTIGDGAFSGCSQLKTVDGLGENVESIGAEAFANCPLTEVQMFAENPPTISGTTFSGLDLDSVPLYVRTKCIPDYAAAANWSGFANIRSRYVEFTLTGIPSGAVIEGNVGKIKSDTYWVVDWDAYSSDWSDGKTGEVYYLPSHTYSQAGTRVFRIEGAVTAIESLELETEEIILDENGQPTEINGKSFVTIAGGDYLTRAVRSAYSPLSEIGVATFLHNENLETTNLKGVETIGKAAFAYSGVTSCEMLEAVSEIGDYAFFGCENLTSVQNLGGTSITIGNYAFAGLGTEKGYPTYIQISVADPQKAVITDTSFGHYDTVPRPVNVYVPMESVGSYASTLFPDGTQNPWCYFKIASQVLEFTLENVPSGTRIIGTSATDSVGTARVESSSAWTIDWGDGTRNSMTAEQTTFPAHVYEYTEANSAYWEERIVDGVSTWYRRSIVISISGSIKSIGCQSANDFPMLATTRTAGNPYLTKIAASESMEDLTTIGDYAFQGSVNLGSVSGFVNVKEIGRNAFQGCSSLAGVGDADTGFKEALTIGGQAFADCTSLTSLIGFPKVLTIGIRAFANCISLTGTAGLGSAYKELSLKDCPSTSFSAYAFDGCDFGSIDMDSYAKPPTIQTTTFPGDPADVYVFVSQADGSLEAYRKAPVWMRYFNNIISSSSIEIKFAPGVIVGGVILDGSNCQISYTGNFVSIDWGDGIVEGVNNSDSTKSAQWTLPTHTYPLSLSGGSPITIRIRGKVQSIESGDKDYQILSLRETLVTSTDIIRITSDGEYVKQNTTFEVKYNKEEGKFYRYNEQKSDEYTSPDSATGTTIEKNKDSKPILDMKILEFSIGDGSGLEEIGKSCLRDSGVVEVYIGSSSEGTVNIADNAFNKCTHLTKVTANGKVVGGIGESAFYGDILLTDIDFISGVGSLGKSAFFGCTGLTKIKLPATLSSVSESCFEGCSNIGFGLYAEYGIEWEQAESIVGFANCTIGDRAFYGCSGVNNEGWGVFIPSQVHSIGVGAFSGCGMKSFQWGEDGDYDTNPYSFSTVSSAEESSTEEEPAEVYKGVFEECRNLETIVSLPNVPNVPNVGLAIIPRRAFFNCSKLRSTAFLPTSITSIGEEAFSGCSLSEGILLENCTVLKTIANGAFSGSIAQTLTLPASNVLELSEYAFAYNENLTYLRWATGGQPKVSKHCFEGCTALTTVESFGGVTSIPAYCFFLCSSLKDANPILANATDDVGEYCFAGCTGLGNVIIPASVTGLGEGCFACASENFLRGFYDESLIPTDESKIRESHGTIAGFERWMYKSYMDKRVDVWSVYDEKCLNSGENVGPTGIKWEHDAGAAYSIGPACFMDCSRMLLGEGFELTEVPAFAFYNCASLFGEEGPFDSVVTKDTTVVGKFSFAHTNVRSFGVADDENQGYAILSPAAFLGCMSLSDISAIGNIFGSVPSALPDAFFYGCSGLKDISVFREKFPIRALGNYCFAGCTGLDFVNNEEGSGSVYDVMRQVSKIGDGCFMGCTGGTVYVPRLISYIPYRAFADNPNVSNVVFSYGVESEDPTASSITLEGDAFEGCRGIEEITIPYPSVAAIVAAKGNISDTEEIDSSDPFPDIAEVTIEEEDKKDAAVVVPQNFVKDYKDDAYWGRYREINESGGVTPDVKDPVLQLDMEIPAGGSTVTLTGIIGIADKGSAYITWGDGAVDKVDVGSTNVAHTYVSGQYKLIVSGAVTSLSGRSVTVGSSKYYIPLFSSSIDTETNSYSNSVVSVASVQNPAYGVGGNPIGAYCFYNHGSLNKVEFKSEVAPYVTSIADGTFLSCRSLSTIEGPLNNVTKIGNAAFKYTAKLKTLEFFSNNGQSALTNIGAECFYGIGLESLGTLPTSVVSLGTKAFAWCKELTSLSGIENTGIQSLSVQCFRGCTKLENVSALADKHITTIPDNCFSACDQLKSVSGLGIGVIEKEAFADSGLTSFEGINSDASIYARAFSGTKITSLAGMPQIENIPEGCFNGCAGLTSLDGMYEGVKSLGAESFAGSGLTSLTGMTNIVNIPDGCFKGCAGLTSLDGMYSGVGTLGDGCFEGCKNITSVALPNGVSTIGLRAFKGCDGINTITLTRGGTDESEITRIADGGGVADQTAQDYENRSFEYTTIINNEDFVVKVPNNTVPDDEDKSIYESAYGWKNFTGKFSIVETP